MHSDNGCESNGKLVCANLYEPPTTPDFWEHYNAHPKEVRELADKNYGLLQSETSHLSLHFKRLKDDVWSVRVGRSCRALAFEHEKGYDWFWIGPHSEYDHILTRL